MSRRRIDYDPHDASALAELLSTVQAARSAEDRLGAVEQYYRAETHGRRATGEAIIAALEAGHSARTVGQVLGLTHAAVTARARAARTDLHKRDLPGGQHV